MEKYKFRLLNEDEIDVRVGNVVNTAYRKGANLLLYKNARVDMDILDETVGAENWTRGHQEIKGNLYCNVSIYDEAKKEWITKQDCGVESNTEKEKGEASDSFKRACVNWGIGRELYTSPKIAIDWEVDEKNKLKFNPTFYVKSIKYDEKRRIVQLTIVAVSGGKEKVVFDWSQGTKNEEQHNGENFDKKEEKEVSSDREQQALDFVMPSGKHGGKKLRDIPIDWLEWASKNFSGKWKENVDIVLAWKEKRQKERQEKMQVFDDNESDIPF